MSIYTLADRVRRHISAEGGSFTDEQVMRMCEQELHTERAAAGLPFLRQRELIRLVFCALRCELEIIQDLADDSEVTEIMVNGADSIFVERAGCISRVELSFENRERLESVIQRLAARVGREINDLNPIVDARLADGSRVNAVHASVGIGGPYLTIRKFNRNRMTMEDLIDQGDISYEAASLLGRLVAAGYNMFVSGGTSSGKTTFLNILSDHIPGEERIVVIEDSAELQIRGRENLVRLEARSPNAQGRGEVSIRELIKTSLRMRPDRIIVGEVRGEEVVDMLAAMSTGHDGSLSTGHANSIRGMLGRLETLHISASGFPLQSVRTQIAQAIEIFVHLARSSGGARRVMELSEVAGMSGGEIVLNPLFVYEAGRGLCPTGNSLKNSAKLRIKEEGERVD